MIKVQKSKLIKIIRDDRRRQTDKTALQYSRLWVNYVSVAFIYIIFFGFQNYFYFVKSLHVGACFLISENIVIR